MEIDEKYGSASGGDGQPDADALRDLALELNDRYLHEFIEPHSICPYARGARRAGNVERYVYAGRITSAGFDAHRGAMLELARGIASDAAQEVALVICPLAEVTPGEWHRIASALAAELREEHGETVLVNAAFHPDLTYRSETAAGTVPLMRRSPDPTIQWVRNDVLDAVTKGRRSSDAYLDPRLLAAQHLDALASKPSLTVSERIARDNWERAQAMEFGEVESMLAAFREERNRRYRALLGYAPGVDRREG